MGITQNMDLSVDFIIDREFNAVDPANVLALQVGFRFDLSGSDE
jgi:hypothetical protein